MNDTPLVLGEARTETLEHGLALILESWRGFDRARSYQPPITDHIRTLLGEGLPEAGIGPHAALDEVSEILDESLAHSRPRFFGYVGSSGLELGVLADALAGSHDINLAASAAAADLVERQTLELGRASSSATRPHWGTFTSGGHALQPDGAGRRPGARPAGQPHRRLRRPRCRLHERRGPFERRAGGGGARPRPQGAADDRDRRRPAHAGRGLRRRHRADVAAGLQPVAVVATAGTTLTGAVDPIRSVAEVCAARGVWLHVDGAYGLPAAATASARHLFDGLELRRLG